MPTTEIITPNIQTMWIIAGLSLVIAAVSLVVWRTERASLLLLLIGPLLGLLTAGSLGWVSVGAWALACAVCLAIASMGYWAARSGLFSLSQPASLVAGGIAVVGVLMTLIVMNQIREESLWHIFALPVGVVWAFLVGLTGAMARRALAGQPGGAKSEQPAEGKAEEKKIILDMLARDKISAAEAAELLDAFGREETPADRLPLTGGIIASLAGGVVIVTGWVMPWAYMPLPVLVRYSDMVVMEEVTGYLAGYHLGFHGWLILLLGVAPAILACIPALDIHLRQGMLRLFMALIGAAFTVALLSMSLRQSAPSVGPIMCLVGFVIQAAGALSESRLIDAREPSAGEGGKR